MARIVDVLIEPAQGVGATVVSIGLALDGGQVGWGDCIELQHPRDVLLATLQRHVAPVLIGRELTSFRTLSAEIQAITEPIIVVETIHHPPPPPKEGVSRRQMFALEWQPEPPPAPPPTVTEREEVRPILASVRHGASQALLNAFALAHNVSVTEFVCREYALPYGMRTVGTLPFLLLRQLNSAGRMLAYRPNALGLALASTNYDAEMGERSAHLTSAVAQFSADAVSVDPTQTYCPTLYLRLYGGLGAQEGSVAGRILGRLFTLQKGAKPYHLLVEDAAIGNDWEQHVKLNKQLQKLTALRKLGAILVAKLYVDSLARVQAVIENELAHAVYLDPVVLGDVDTMIEAVKLCRGAGILSIWGGHSAETALSATTTAHIVMACQPDFVVTKPATQVGLTTMQNDMARILRWMEHNQINRPAA